MPELEYWIEQFNLFLLGKFVNASQDASSYTAETFVTALAADPLWESRARVVQHAFDASKLSSDQISETLRFYEQHAQTAESVLEAARAAVVFEEPELLLKYIEKAETLLNFRPKLEGVSVKLSTGQNGIRTRVGCLVESAAAVRNTTAAAPSIDRVKLTSNNNDILDPPEFVNSDQQQLSTSLLSGAECVLLLLRASYVGLTNPGSLSSSVVNEQSLPYIRRITEIREFDNLDFEIQKQALYSRSVLEMRDINELERGTVQLMKISKVLHTGNSSSLEHFHQLPPLAWTTVDELAARRLVAMSDFANAIPLYQYLNKPMDVAICLTATDNTAEALKVLEAPELENDAQALLLRGDISSDVTLWQRAWDNHREVKAKYRLAQRSVADGNLEMALSHLNELLEIDSTNYDALKLAAAAAMSLQKWDLSVTHLRRQLASNEDDASGWFNLATALLQLNQPQAAHHAIKQAIRVNQNRDPHLPTYTNFVALSAQLGLYDDVLVGLTRLCQSEDKASGEYVSKVTSVLPRLVSHFTKTTYTGSMPQKQLVDLLVNELPKVISLDDPMLCRLSGQVELWAGHYQDGLTSLNKAVDLLVRDGASQDDARAKARLRLYGGELVSALEKYGDKPGRIEGSKSFPGWQARKLAVEKLI